MFFPFSRRFPASLLFARRTQRVVRQACLLAGCLGVYGSAHALDVNQATVDQLEALRGLGAKTAALIVKERARGGPYESMNNLAERVKGLGVKKARLLEAAGLRAGPVSAPSAVAKPAATGGAQGQPRPRRPIQAPTVTPASR